VEQFPINVKCDWISVIILARFKIRAQHINNDAIVTMMEGVSPFFLRLTNSLYDVASEILLKL